MLLLCQKQRASWHSLVPMQVSAEVKVCPSTQCHRLKSSQGPDRQIALTVQLQTFLSLVALPDLNHICILQFMFWFGWSPAWLWWCPWPAAESPCAPRGCPADTKPLATTKGPTAIGKSIGVWVLCVHRRGTEKGGDRSHLVTGSHDHLPWQSL